MAGVDPRVAAAIIDQESRNGQRLGPIATGFDLAQEIVTTNSAKSFTIGMTNIKRGTFAKTAVNHPEVLGREVSYEYAKHAWSSLIHDEELAIRATIWYLADLQESLPVEAPSVLESGYSSFDLLAYGYQQGAGSMGEFAQGGVGAPRGLAYVADFRDDLLWASETYCQSGRWSCEIAGG